MIKRFGLWIVMAVVLMVVSSCSDSKLREVLDGVPAESDVVAVVNLREVLESAGGSVDGTSVKLPSYITGMLSDKDAEELDGVKEFLLKSGIDPEVCAIFSDYENGRPVMVFLLNDKSKLVEKLEDDGYREKATEDDMVIYTKKTYEGYSSDYDDYTYIAVSDDHVYRIDDVWVGSSFKPLPFLRRIGEKLADGSFASSVYCDYVMDGNLGGLYAKLPKELKREMRKAGVPDELLDVYDGAVCLHGNIEVDRLVVEATLHDAEGKEFEVSKLNSFINGTSTISSEALSYLGKDERLVYAVSMKDVKWDKYAEALEESGKLSGSERAAVSVVMDYLRKIDGTVAVGYGLSGGLESVKAIVNGDVKEMMQQMSVTMVVETKEGKAKLLVDDLKSLLGDMGLSFSEESDGFTVDLGSLGLGGMVELRHKGNVIVLANHAVKAGSCSAVVKDAGLDKHLAALFAGLEKGNKLMRDLNVKYDVSCKLSVDPGKAQMRGELVVAGDDSKGLIEKIARTMIGIADNADDINAQLGQRHTDYGYDEDDYSDMDTVAVDSVAY